MKIRAFPSRSSFLHKNWKIKTLKYHFFSIENVLIYIHLHIYAYANYIYLNICESFVYVQSLSP